MQDEDPLAGAYEPGSHWVQLSCPDVSVYEPAAQGVQGATEVFENVPAAQPVTQLAIDVEPGAEVKPFGHWLHWDEFAGDQDLIGHVTQDLAPTLDDVPATLDDVPAGQTLQGDIPVLENMPPGQRGVQLEAPARDDSPAGHCAHSLEPAFENLPAGQIWHLSLLVWPMLLLKVPASQGVQGAGAPKPLLDHVPAGHIDRQSVSDEASTPGNVELPSLHFLQAEREVEPFWSL